MENLNKEFPTEVLVDLKEDNFISHVYYKEIQTSSDNHKSMKYVTNKENDSFEISQEKYQCILDMSPFRLKEKFRDPVMSLNASSNQVMKDAVDDCPTAVLVDVPNSASLHSKGYSVLTDKYDYQKDKLVKCKSLVLDIEEQKYISSARNKCSAIEGSDDPYFISMKNKLSPPRPLWKTPSPQSMSRISKEASKIIHNLNSSVLFDDDDDDDSLICEEILPIPFNFDNFDLEDNSDQEDLFSVTENSCTDKLLNHKSSVSIQTTKEIINSEMTDKGIVEISGSSVLKDNYSISKDQNCLTQSPSEPFDSQINSKGEENFNECSITSEELKSFIQSDSLNNSDFSVCNEGTNDVFLKNSISSEDKENIVQKEFKEKFLTKIISSDTLLKNSLVSKKKMGNHGTLKNLSNVKHNSDSRNLPNSINKKTVSHMKVNTKEFPFPAKQQLKKTTSAMESRTLPKMISRSSSFQCNSTRELTSSFKKPHSVKQDSSFLSNSEYKSSTSDVKDAFAPMKTPSRRYSVATPLKSASAKKPPLTPALSRFQSPSVPRYTHQSVGGNRLSFSKSWQQSNNVSNIKSFKCQNSISTPSTIPKPSFSSGICSSKPNKQAVCESNSTLSCQTQKNAVSTLNKKRFCSKLGLPSPLLAEQDRKLARVLFPSITKK